MSASAWNRGSNIVLNLNNQKNAPQCQLPVATFDPLMNNSLLMSAVPNDLMLANMGVFESQVGHLDRFYQYCEQPLLPSWGTPSSFCAPLHAVTLPELTPSGYFTPVHSQVDSGSLVNSVVVPSQTYVQPVFPQPHALMTSVFKPTESALRVPGGYQCPVPECSSVFVKKDSIKRHWETKHDMARKEVKCKDPGCDLRFGHIREMNRHAKIHEKKFHYCPCKNKVYTRLYLLKKHCSHGARCGGAVDLRRSINRSVSSTRVVEYQTSHRTEKGEAQAHNHTT